MTLTAILFEDDLDRKIEDRIRYIFLGSDLLTGRYIASIDDLDRNNILAIGNSLDCKSSIFIYGDDLYNDESVDLDLKRSDGLIFRAIDVVSEWCRSRVRILFYYEMGDGERIRFASGSLQDLRDLIRINDGWEDVRFDLERRSIIQNSYSPLLYEVVPGIL